MSPSEDVDEGNVEDYDYPEKYLARALVEIALRDRFKTLKGLKILALEGYKGLDLRQKFYPLGAERRNITIVEKEDHIFKLMKKSSYFKGVNLIEGDLNAIELKNGDGKFITFDIVSLDTNGYITDAFLDMLTKETMTNVGSNTTMYLNAMARREKGYITQMYQAISDDIVRQINDIETKSSEAKKIFEQRLKDELFEILVSKMKEEGVAIATGSESKKEIWNKIMTQYRSIDRIMDDVDCLSNAYTYDDLVQYLKSLRGKIEGKDNYHIQRAIFLLQTTRNALNAILENHDHYQYDIPSSKIVEYYKSLRRSSSTISVPVEDEVRSIVTELLRIATKSPSIKKVKHFTYRSNLFISTIVELAPPTACFEYKDGYLDDIVNALYTAYLISKKKMGVLEAFDGLREFWNEWIQQKIAGDISEEAKNAFIRDRIRKCIKWFEDIVDLLVKEKILVVEAKGGTVELCTRKSNFDLLRYSKKVPTISPTEAKGWNFKKDAKFLCCLIHQAIDNRVDFLMKTLLHDSEPLGSQNVKQSISEIKALVPDYEDDEEKFYIRGKLPSVIDAEKILGKQWEEERKGMIKEFVSSLTPSCLRDFIVKPEHVDNPYLSSEVASNLNRLMYEGEKLDTNYFVADYEVRGHKIWLDELEVEMKKCVTVKVTREEVAQTQEEEESFREGRTMQLTMNKIERDPTVRLRTLEAHKSAEGFYYCLVCGRVPYLEYDDVSKDFGLIAHHLKPLSESGEVFTNPKRDCATVCVLCHSLIHKHSKKGELLSVEEAKKKLLVRRKEYVPDEGSCD